MNVLVTGSAGYIGSVLVPALKRAGHTVLGYDTGWFGDDTQSTWFVRGDIREPLVHPLWPDVVVHLAGLSNDPMGDLDADLTWGINHYGTLSMMQRHDEARHVIISSCAVYGQASTLCDEATPVNPQTTYAECKALVDEWATNYVPDHAILRLGTVFGPSPNHRLDLVVNRMVYDAMNSRSVRVTGDAARPLTHIEDVASAIVWAVGNDAQGIYNVVGENVRMKELGRDVARVASCPVKFESGGADTRDYMASGRKLLAAGWYPTRSVAGSLPALFEFTADFIPAVLGPTDSNYIRLAQLTRLIESGELDPQTLRRAA